MAVDNLERFRRKTRQFLEEREGLVAVEKLHRNRPITETDLAELQRVLIETGVVTMATWSGRSRRPAASVCSSAA